MHIFTKSLTYEDLGKMCDELSLLHRDYNVLPEFASIGELCFMNQKTLENIDGVFKSLRFIFHDLRYIKWPQVLSTSSLCVKEDIAIPIYSVASTVEFYAFGNDIEPWTFDEFLRIDTIFKQYGIIHQFKK